MTNTLDELFDKISKEKLNCAQKMMACSLELRGRSNPELVHSLFGLGGGLQTQSVCGTLSGGCCALSSYYDPEDGAPDDDLRARHRQMIQTFVRWFEEEYGSQLCRDLIGDDMSKKISFCPGLIRASFEKCLVILDENGFDYE